MMMMMLVIGNVIGIVRNMYISLGMEIGNEFEEKSFPQQR